MRGAFVTLSLLNRHSVFGAAATTAASEPFGTNIRIQRVFAQHSCRDDVLLILIFVFVSIWLDDQQVAVIAGNLELAEMIQNYKPEDIGKIEHHYLFIYTLHTRGENIVCL